MAGSEADINVYDKTGNNLLYRYIGMSSETITITELLGRSWNSNGDVTQLSDSVGGDPLPGNTIIFDYFPDVSYNGANLYDVTLGPGCHQEDDYSAMRGPCDEGYHVPLTTERQAVIDIQTALGGGSSGTNFGIALKLPFAGRRYSSSAGVGNQGSYGYYWSSSRSSGSSAYDVLFTSTSLYPQDASSRAYGFSVRCFKDSPVTPTSSWTKLYGTSIESGGIFWSSTDGLISLSSDGQTWITIADKNLGATTVWNSGDTLSEANCGKYYQRGNNYGFPRTGTIANQSTTQVDASSYGPGNYYSSDTFIKYNGRWDTTDNRNLWGGETGVTKKEVCPPCTLHGHIGTWHMERVPGEDDYSAMRGPCDEGYHVPLRAEWQSVYDAGVTIGAWTSSGGNNLSSYLKLPFAGGRNYSTSGIVNQGSNGLYWSSSRNSGSSAYDVLFNSSTIYPQFNNLRALGASVRSFKDIPIIPDYTWVKLYGTSVESGGIFWHKIYGIISISSDGANWITIADKNLGATTVWNSGDTLSEANCGKYYQWGNNYGFPWTGSVTTSSTQVNASTYGPGNYYSSSTFITYSGAWDTTDNGNLRGGETGVIQTGHYQRRTY